MSQPSRQGPHSLKASTLCLSYGGSHNPHSSRVTGDETFCFFETWIPVWAMSPWDLLCDRRAALTTTPEPRRGCIHSKHATLAQRCPNGPTSNLTFNQHWPCNVPCMLVYMEQCQAAQRLISFFPAGLFVCKCGHIFIVCFFSTERKTW